MGRRWHRGQATAMTTTRARRGAPDPRRTGRVAAVVAILVLGWLLVFRLPWHVPVRTDVQADSALFGFSNAAAILGLAATLFGLLVVRRVGPPSVADTNARRPLVSPPDRRTRGEWIALAACSTVAAAVVLGWWATLPNAYFGESTYFLTRLDMLALGLRPYRDFDYGYGPALLDVPWLAHRLSGGRLGADTAFIASVAAQHVLGILAASAILARVCPAPEMSSSSPSTVSSAVCRMSCGRTSCPFTSQVPLTSPKSWNTVLIVSR